MYISTFKNNETTHTETITYIVARGVHKLDGAWWVYGECASLDEAKELYRRVQEWHPLWKLGIFKRVLEKRNSLVALDVNSSE